jgi:hypothetical protein
LLVQKGVVPQGGVLLHHEVLLGFSVLVGHLLFQIVCELNFTLLFLLLFLLFGDSQLFVSQLPEL